MRTGRARGIPNRLLARLGLKVVRVRPAAPRPAPVAARRPAPDAPALFVGHTRFSVIDGGRSAFKISRGGESVQEYARRLYAPARMDPRMEVFATLVAPGLQAYAAAHDYRHIVTYSELMPRAYRERLTELAAAYPVLELVASDGTSNDLSASVLPWLRAAGRSRVVAQFRVDDDDLLSVDYLDRLARFATRRDVGRSINLASGVTAHLTPAGRVRNPRTVEQPFGSRGQGYIGRYDAERDTLTLDITGQHSRMYRQRPHLVHAGPPAFLILEHSGQDTLLELSPEQASRRIDERLAALPEADPHDVLKAFPVLAGVLDGVDEVVQPVDPPSSAGPGAPSVGM